jgi:sodium/hydrogen antiporter
MYPMYQNMALLAVLAFLYSTFAKGLERTWIGGPIIFTVFGVALGPLGADILSLNITSQTLRMLAEMTLAIVLFTDAANADLGVLRKSLLIPWRLLAIGLPLTILAGFAVGVVLFDELTVFELAILATMLAATDAALGKSVITNESVPARIRESLNIESGLNDGIAVPILFIFIALALNVSGDSGGVRDALVLVAEEIGIGLVVGLTLAAGAAWALSRSAENDWLSDVWMQITVFALAIACFATAQSMGGSGFIAAFSAGLLFGKMTQRHKHDLLRATEGTGDAFAWLTWTIFGAAVVARAIDSITWQILLYSVLSLTVVRMLPVFLSLTGTGERAENKLFLGWFGPRGLASIVFAIIVLDKNIPGANTLAVIVVCTVCISIIAHGVSAIPLSKVIAEGGSDDPRGNACGSKVE